MTTNKKTSRRTSAAKILIPVGDLVSRELITQALHVLSSFKNPTVVLLHVIEVPSRTSTLEPDPYRAEIKEAQKKLGELAKWLADQGLEVRIRVGVARNAAEGIIEETETDGYLIVFLMKRKSAKGWRRLFRRSVSERVIRSASCLVLTAPLEQLEQEQ